MQQRSRHQGQQPKQNKTTTTKTRFCSALCGRSVSSSDRRWTAHLTSNRACDSDQSSSLTSTTISLPQQSRLVLALVLEVLLVLVPAGLEEGVALFH